MFSTKAKMAILASAIGGSVLAISPAAFASDGAELFQENCAVCHGGDAVENERVAPPIVGIRNHYIQQFPEEAEFKAAIADWLKEPDEAKSHMPGAISKFGLMPALEVSDEDAVQIAEYLYAGDLEKPGWYDAHAQKEHGKQMMGKQKMGKGEMQGMRHQRGEPRWWWQRLWGE